MIAFIDLQTDSHERRKVCISYTSLDQCQLLGNLEHCTKFKRADLVKFAHDVLAAFDVDFEFRVDPST